MNRQLPPEVKAQLDSQGTAISGDIGGTKRRRYWTPDGREVQAVPAMRTWIKKKDGKVIDSGLRDANLDKGWLSQPPTELKPYCPSCDGWHGTLEEVDACIAKKKAFDERWVKKAKGMKREEPNEVEGIKAEVSEIKSEMSDIKSMLSELLAKKGQIVSEE